MAKNIEKTWFRARIAVVKADGEIVNRFKHCNTTKASVMRAVNRSKESWGEDCKFIGTLQQFSGKLSYATDPDGLIAEQQIIVR